MLNSNTVDINKTKQTQSFKSIYESYIYLLFRILYANTYIPLDGGWVWGLRRFNTSNQVISRQKNKEKC